MDVARGTAVTPARSQGDGRLGLRDALQGWNRGSWQGWGGGGIVIATQPFQ
jgi:hypothetical protein